YSTFNGSTSGSTAVGTGTAGSADVLGSLAAATIRDDLNNKTPIRIAVVANDTGFAADWEGNFSSNFPQLTLDTTQVPEVTFSSPTYSTTETDQVAGHTTPLTFNITRTSNPSTTTKIHWTATSNNVPAGGFTAQSGDVTFNPGDVSKPVTINFNNIT